MFKSIKWRLTITYGLLFLIAIAFIDFILITLYCNQQFDKTEKVYSQMAKIVSEMTVRNLSFPYFINSSGNAENSLSGRVLALNLEKRVVADSLKQFDGQLIDNPELRKTYSTYKTSIGYYILNGDRIAMLSYPMFKKSIFAGAVLISYNVTDLWNENFRFAVQVIIISLLVIIIILILTYIIGKKISSPLKKMTLASLEILNGKPGVTVDVQSYDELGSLSKTFNKMSSELQRIELGRKRFLSSVSHEFKTPLTSIKALIEPFMGETLIDGKMLNEHLFYVDSEIDRLTKLVKSLVTVTRLEEITPSISKLNIYSEVSSIIRILSPLASDKNISLENNISKDLNINTDQQLFREIIINLIDNSIKYGNENGLINLYSIIHTDHLEIIIKDNGIGISESDLPNIFDNFYMSDSARKSGNGSGIGLYVVKKIIKLLNWNISVNSSLSSGSEFIITIPTIF
ncbi:MAG: HAMP domain-containing sensor histidine kinase [Bacillota bacterium]|nr:HAMP domain-containing sensor histidine kinase [Bacillota bacterium]